MDNVYFSVRMHASRSGVHLSGAEDLVPEADIASAAQACLQRALQHQPDAVRLAIDPVPAATIVDGRLPDLVLTAITDVEDSRRRALDALVKAGVSCQAAAVAMQALAEGAAAPGRVMRGAMLVDAESGARLEHDRERGVRVSHFGWGAGARDACMQLLQRHGLEHFRTREALALAAKVLAADGVLAELCWSDDPQYTAGYVASKSGGYLRLPHLKSAGDPLGGRAFFIAPGRELPPLIDFLEKTPFLISALGAIIPENV